MSLSVNKSMSSTPRCLLYNSMKQDILHFTVLLQFVNTSSLSCTYLVRSPYEVWSTGTELFSVPSIRSTTALRSRRNICCWHIMYVNLYLIHTPVYYPGIRFNVSLSLDSSSFIVRSLCKMSSFPEIWIWVWLVVLGLSSMSPDNNNWQCVRSTTELRLALL